MPISTVIHTNEHSIDRVLAAGVPLLLVFWQRTQPLPPEVEAQLDTLAGQYAGKAIVAKVDAGAERTLVARFAPSRIPAILVLQGSKREAELTAGELNRAGAWLAHLVNGAPRPAVAPPPPPTTNGEPLVLTDANFQKTIQGSLPVLVDFWAPWCGPCRMVAPHVERLAREYQGRAVVGKLNVDENPMTSQQYGIMSIPALYIFVRGQVADQIVGAQPYQVLQQRLDRVVK
ncbi:MAG: thioredoxin [Anaerolineales bacterium]|nr:thioredoxin [Anaerolineales bacterium]